MTDIDVLNRQIDRLRAVNGELVEALSSLYRLVSYMKELKPDSLWQMVAAKKAIARATSGEGK